PKLRDEAYQAKKLDKQLEEQGRIFMHNRGKNRVDAGEETLYLSPIFDWFEEDFVDHSGSVEKFVAPYFPEKDANRIRRGGLDIEYTHYSWKLNES
ncbi:MAG: hypothetical protein R3242_09650, partial [Akkermansiaceae bacterium]|nr:hypothetical protein [Akkermansiaceae bacterium]